MAMMRRIPLRLIDEGDLGAGGAYLERVLAEIEGEGRGGIPRKSAGTPGEEVESKNIPAAFGAENCTIARPNVNAMTIRLVGGEFDSLANPGYSSNIVCMFIQNYPMTPPQVKKNPLSTKRNANIPNSNN